jgi:hypothetical protein
LRRFFVFRTFLSEWAVSLCFDFKEKDSVKNIIYKIFLLLLVGIAACQSGELDPLPSDSLATLLEEMILPANTLRVRNKAFPSVLPNSSFRFSYVPSVSVAAGSTPMSIPVFFTGSGSFSALFVKVDGADSVFFKIPVVPDTLGRQNVIYMPLRFTDKAPSGGSIKLSLALGKINTDTIYSNIASMQVALGGTRSCGGSLEGLGKSNITQTEYNVEGQSGAFQITLEPYSVPDRLDVYADGRWIAGTGSQAPSRFPAYGSCSSPAAGFVGNQQQDITFNVSNARRLQVYVWGCTGNPAVWKYSLGCP